MKKSNIKLLCSTGTMVGRSNGYDLRRAVSELSRLVEKDIAFGGELMMLSFYYDKEKSVIDCIKASGVSFPVTHCEKEVGTDLSRAAFLHAEGMADDAATLTDANLKVFEANCRFAEAVGSVGLVLHLWGGRESDGYVDYNCSLLPRLNKAAREHGLCLLIENVPSSKYDPLSNWHKVIEALPEISLIFDTRFGKLHEQTEETLTDIDVIKRLRHLHVSDYVGGYRRFENLRPIPHPGDGVVDFDIVKRCLKHIEYSGTVTLESPVMTGDSLDITRLERSLLFIDDLLS